MTDPGSDRVLRAMTDDGAFRVMTLRGTDMVRGVLAAQSVVGEVARQTGELLCGAVLMRQTMSPENRVQMLLIDPEHGRIVADAWKEGFTRGLVQLANPAQGLVLGGGTHLQVVRVIHGGKHHQGIVETTPDDQLSEAMMRYFQQSEQIVTMTQVACVLDGERVRAAGGFVIQLLPELTEPPLAKMTELLREFGSLGDWLRNHGDDPDRLRRTLLQGQAFTHLADDPVKFACPCDEDRAVAAIATLSRDELQELIDTGGELPVDCDYCAEHYVMREEHFRRVLDAIDGQSS